MSRFQHNIYEDLIADKDFLNWASNNDKSNSAYWEEWKDNHTDCDAEFDEALKTVQLIRFNTPKVSKTEISYLWQKTQNKLPSHNSISRIRQLMVWGSKIAAVLILPLIISVFWLYQKNTDIQTAYNQMAQYNHENPVRVKAPKGGLVNLELPDGSKVWLNADSEIEYPASFRGEQREVSISGEAFFEIEKSEAPFIVNNPGPQIKVYGTQFNVSAYTNEPNVTVALAEGKVALDVNGEEVFLRPGEVSKFDKENRELSISQTNIDQFISWREGKLIFRDATMASIIRTLERRYNATIEVRDKEVANYKYNAIIQGETFEQILDLLSRTAPIKCKYIKPKQNDDSSFTQAEVIITKDKNRIVKQ